MPGTASSSGRCSALYQSLNSLSCLASISTYTRKMPLPFFAMFHPSVATNLDCLFVLDCLPQVSNRACDPLCSRHTKPLLRGLAGIMSHRPWRARLARPKARCLFFESASRFRLLLEHGVFRKPVPTFRHHAL